MKLFLSFIYLFCIFNAECGIFSWLFDDYSENCKKSFSTFDAEKLSTSGSAVYEELVNSEVVSKADIVPFEMTPTDEKFLQAVPSTSLQLSELDMCQHKVIMSLEESCGEMTEESLSKVAVNLLNCQSIVEGRKTYPCSKDMSILECTRSMDSDTWNAYHIVSNRARAVCYAMRQLQFRAQTEMVVNKLVMSSKDQIEKMENLKNSQQILGKLTSETLQNLSLGHQELKVQQNELSSASRAIQTFMLSNLKDLELEKSVIAQGQKEITVLIEHMKKKLDETYNQMSKQEVSQMETHSRILDDLSEIHRGAHKVWNKLEVSTQKILAMHEETFMQYSKITQDLLKMNATVYDMMGIFETTRQGLEDRLSWIISLIGGTVKIFYKVPYLTRITLVVLVCTNIMLELNYEVGLNFYTLTTALVSVLLAHVICIVLRGYYGIRWSFCPPVSTSNIQRTTRLNFPEKLFLKSTSKADVWSARSFDSYGLEASSESISPERSIYTSSLSWDKPLLIDKIEKPYRENTVTSPYENKLHSTSWSALSEKSLPQDHVKRDLLSQLEDVDNSTLRRNTINMSNSSCSSTPKRYVSLNLSVRSGSSLNSTSRIFCSGICKNGLPCRNAVSTTSEFCHRHINQSRESSFARETHSSDK